MYIDRIRSKSLYRTLSKETPIESGVSPAVYLDAIKYFYIWVSSDSMFIEPFDYGLALYN